MRSMLFHQLHHTITRKFEDCYRQDSYSGMSSFTVQNSVLTKLIEIDRLLASEDMVFEVGDLLAIPGKPTSAGQQLVEELVGSQVEPNGD